MSTQGPAVRRPFPSDLPVLYTGDHPNAGISFAELEPGFDSTHLKFKFIDDFHRSNFLTVCENNFGFEITEGDNSTLSLKLPWPSDDVDYETNMKALFEAIVKSTGYENIYTALENLTSNLALLNDSKALAPGHATAQTDAASTGWSLYGLGSAIYNSLPSLPFRTRPS